MPLELVGHVESARSTRESRDRFPSRDGAERIDLIHRTKGKGSVAVILPDTKTSARYTEFDAPLLKKAFKLAGLKPALDRICREASEAIEAGDSLIVLSDRACDKDRVPMSTLLACALMLSGKSFRASAWRMFACVCSSFLRAILIL